MDRCREGHKPGCVVLAAGLGTRFGGDKLLAEFDGVPLYRRVLEAVPEALRGRTAVVSGDGRILGAAREAGCTAAENRRPEEGISLSIRLGLDALDPDCTGALFLVGDQPLLSAGTVERLLEAAREHPEAIIVPVRGDGEPGNPCFFPARFFGELRQLRGDRGGRRIIAAHPEAVVSLTVEERELADVDSPEALAALEKSM